MSVWKWLILVIAAPAMANSPPLPLAEGPFESIVKAARAARSCGIVEVRLEVRPGTTRMFYAGDPQPGRGKSDLVCLANWQRKNATRLNLAAEWFAYDYGPRPTVE